jgi:FG-GAP repeat
VKDDPVGKPAIQASRVVLFGVDGVFTNETSSLWPSTKSGDDWGGTTIAVGDVDGDDLPDVVVTKAASITSGSTHLSSTWMVTMTTT